MSFLKKNTSSNTSLSLIKGFEKVLNTNPQKLSLAVLSSLILLSSTASAYTYADIPLASNNFNAYEKILSQIDMGNSNQYNKIIKQFDNSKYVVIIIDNDASNFVPLDELNMPNSSNSYSHMDMVEHSIEKNLSFTKDRDVAIIKSNVFSGDSTTLNTAFNNIKQALQDNPDKEFIINMSLEGGVNFFGNVSFHKDIIDLAKNYSNIKIIKSAGNATSETSLLSSINKSIKPLMEKTFKEYLHNNSSYSKNELQKIFIDSTDGYISYIVSHQNEILKILQADKNNFNETEVLKELLISEYDTSTLTDTQRHNLQNNLKIVNAYSPLDFVKDFNNNPDFSHNPQAKKIFFLLKKMDCIDKYNQLSLDNYKNNFNSKNSNIYKEFEKEFTNFILQNKSFQHSFYNGYVNSTSYSFSSTELPNFVTGPTDIMRTFFLHGEKFHYLSTGSSTAAPEVTSLILKELRTNHNYNQYSHKHNTIIKNQL